MNTVNQYLRMQTTFDANLTGDTSFITEMLFNNWDYHAFTAIDVFLFGSKVKI